MELGLQKKEGLIRALAAKKGLGLQKAYSCISG